MVCFSSQAVHLIPFLACASAFQLQWKGPLGAPERERTANITFFISS